jgi:hypothetical protein
MNGDDQIAGQLSIFDFAAESEGRKPCEYDFQRQIGQRVILANGKIGKITKIEPYYTEVDVGDDHIYAGTPTTMWPYEEPPETFADYVGKCKYCMWYGYGLYEPYGHKRKKGTEGQNCQWEVSRQGIPPSCKNHSFWKPSIYAIPKLCGNCRHSNCFHYQKKEQYKENDSRAFSDPVEEPNVYCTRDDGSVNRQQPFLAFCSSHFGACLWDRQHEWDTCDAWQTDGQTLKGENE